ncbi:MAG: universal stress protein [Acidobacteria bacterium]|nr:universal stress protein [Acidobacteriota bacterium]
MTAFRKILCPVDFSATSGHAFVYGAAIAQQFGAELILLHVIEEVPLLTAYSGMPEVDSSGEMEKYARAEMANLAAGATAGGAKIRAEIARGKSHTAILKFATENGVDLIVIGKHGRSQLDYWLFGSVTERVIRRAACPVIVVPHPDGAKEI